MERECWIIHMGLIKLEKEVYKPSQTMSTDMDLVLVYKSYQVVQTHNNPEVGAQICWCEEGEGQALDNNFNRTIPYGMWGGNKYEGRGLCVIPMKLRPQSGYSAMLQLRGECEVYQHGSSHGGVCMQTFGYWYPDILHNQLVGNWKSQSITQASPKDSDKQHDVQVAACWTQLAEMQPGLR